MVNLDHLWNDKRRPQVAGQQGLFPAAPHMSDAARYPRGYNPDRQTDVMQALRHPTSDSAGNDDPVLHPLHRTDHPDSGWEKEQNAFHERGLIDAVARSTVPAEHLAERMTGPYKNQENQARLGRILVNHRMTDDAGNGTAAYFSDRQQEARFAEPHETPHPYRSIVMRNQFGIERGDQGAGAPYSFRHDEDQAKTLIHELGHHDSAAQDDWEGHLDRMDYVDGIHMAHPGEEGYADNYADKHYRPDPRTKRPTAFSSPYTSMLGHHDEYRAERKVEDIQSPLDRDKLTGGRSKRVAALRAKPKAASPATHPLGQMGLPF